MVERQTEVQGVEPDCRPVVIALDTAMPLEVRGLPKFDKGFKISVREARLLQDPPWVRSLGKLNLEISTEGWRFPAIHDQAAPPAMAAGPKPAALPAVFSPTGPMTAPRSSAKVRPTQDTVVLKERLLICCSRL